MASKKGSGNASPVQEKQKPTEQAEKATENVQMESEQIPVPEISVRIDKLFDDVTALYHLDDASRMASSISWRLVTRLPRRP